MTFGLPQPRMAGSRPLGVVEAAITLGVPEPCQKVVAAVEGALARTNTEENGLPISMITMRQIAMEVCADHRVAFREILSDRRSRYIVLARHEIWWRCKNETMKSFPTIGRFFRRDHTTIMAGVRKHEERLANKKTEGGCGRRNLIDAPQQTAPTIRVVNE